MFSLPHDESQNSEIFLLCKFFHFYLHLVNWQCVTPIDSESMIWHCFLSMKKGPLRSRAHALDSR